MRTLILVTAAIALVSAGSVSSSRRAEATVPAIPTAMQAAQAGNSVQPIACVMRRVCTRGVCAMRRVCG